MGTENIFFSYSRVDSDFALKLAKDLRATGITLWMDRLDIKPGNHWDTSIENALDEAGCILIILSPNSVISNNVMDEVSFALESGKRVIPVLLKECKIPFRLRRLQRIDFSMSYEEGFNYLLNELQNFNKEPNIETNDDQQSESKKRKEYNDEIDRLLEKVNQHFEKQGVAESINERKKIDENAFTTNVLKHPDAGVLKTTGALSKISTNALRNLFYTGLFLYVVSFFLPMGNVWSSHYGYEAAIFALGNWEIGKNALQDISINLYYIFINFSNLAMLFMAGFYFLKNRKWYLAFVLLGIISSLWWLFTDMGGKDLFISPAYMVWIISQLITAFAFFVKTKTKRSPVTLHS